MGIITITNDNFEEEVLKSKKPVLLDFWAEWCGPCKMQSPILDEIAAELKDSVKIGKVNVDEEAALALKYQVMSIPTLVVMRDGVFQEKAVGLQSKDTILKMLANGSKE
ncbi:MAG: thioredoxin [Lachnospiraceae bacterium]|nr:thioredoxin [Lachnospiraceae bacterium]